MTETTTITGFTPVNTANMASISLRPADNVLEGVMTFICSSGLYKLNLSGNALYALFMLALVADTRIEEKLEIREQDKYTLEQLRLHGVTFNFDTDSRHQPVLPIYASYTLGEKKTTAGLVWDIRSDIMHGLMVQTFVSSFLPKLEALLRKCTPAYHLDTSSEFHIHDLVILKNEFGGDAPAVVRYIYKELQCSADGTIFDMIVTPVATNRMIRAHSVDIVRLGHNSQPLASRENDVSDNVKQYLQPNPDVERELSRFFRPMQESLPRSKYRPVPGL